MSMISLLDSATEKGNEAHFLVAKVVHAIFHDVWCFIPAQGWRVIENGHYFIKEEAILKIKLALSTCVSGAFSEHMIKQINLFKKETEESASKIATYLLNAPYKELIICECEQLFFKSD